MDQSDFDTHLSRILTLWSLVKQAHGADSAAAQDAKQQLIQRYEKAVKRFLKALLPPSVEVEDLFQEFALCLIRGDFHRANPEAGRFRDYVKTVLRHMASRYQQSLRNLPGPLPDGSSELLAVDPDTESFDRMFDAEWRKGLLDRAWQALAAEERQSRTPYYTVLHRRTSNPNMPIADLAEQIRQETGRPMTPANFRKTLQRARHKLAEFLVAEVAHSLTDATPEQLQEELHDLGLLKYCAALFSKTKE